MPLLLPCPCGAEEAITSGVSQRLEIMSDERGLVALGHGVTTVRRARPQATSPAVKVIGHMLSNGAHEEYQVPYWPSFVAYYLHHSRQIGKPVK